MADYMKHLFLQHNYMSLKMKYNQMEYPALGSKGPAKDGFGHIVETEKTEGNEEAVLETENQDTKDEKIAELEAQLQEARNKLERASRSKAKPFDVPDELFDYDEENDSVIIRNENLFDNFIDEKCKARVDRDKKKTDLRYKVLDQIKQIERRKRSLSSSSQVSLTFLGLDSPSRIRDRSESVESRGDPKQSRLAQSQPLL